MPKDFSRDLGYLDKFLQGLRAHAATLDASASSRLVTLLDEQDRAWSEIRGILAGGGGASSTAKPATVSEPAPAAPDSSAAAVTPEAPYKRLTVGSLMQ